MSPSPEPAERAAERHVLVVDDEPTLRLGFSYALANATTIVDTAATGHQALEKIHTRSYDIVILDLRMPELDGLGVIEALRQSGCAVPIVLCSAAITPTAAFSAILHQVPDFLLKPVRPVDLRQVVDYVLAAPETPLARALAAVRQGNLGRALQHLQEDPARDHRANVWLEAIQLVLSSPGEEPNRTHENFLRSSLTALAFRG